jgi:hypothetical protein
VLAALAHAGRELAHVQPCGARRLPCVLDPALDVGFELLAQQREEDVLVRAAGEVCRRVDGGALEEIGVLGYEVLD